jgi:hypothetical protein
MGNSSDLGGLNDGRPTVTRTRRDRLLRSRALFNLLRRRMQKMVDRRFNRARYDADQIIAAFAARLQDAVDLDAVRAGLAGSVQQALEPARISVWIRRSDGSEAVSAS